MAVETVLVDVGLSDGALDNRMSVDGRGLGNAGGFRAAFRHNVARRLGRATRQGGAGKSYNEG